MKIGQWACENFCSYHKTYFLCGYTVDIQPAWEKEIYFRQKTLTLEYRAMGNRNKCPGKWEFDKPEISKCQMPSRSRGSQNNTTQAKRMSGSINRDSEMPVVQRTLLLLKPVLTVLSGDGEAGVKRPPQLQVSKRFSKNFTLSSIILNLFCASSCE